MIKKLSQFLSFVLEVVLESFSENTDSEKHSNPLLQICIFNKMSAPVIINGFNFDNTIRNVNLQKSHPEILKSCKLKTTGTTLAGCVYKDGVVMGSDNRATAGDIIADKSCMKVHYMAPNIYCTGSGTSADCDQVTKMVSKALELHRMETGRENVRLITANRMLSQHLFKYQGHVSTGLILGGVDCKGPGIYSIAPHGSTAKLPYTTQGSGCLAAMSILEAGWKPNMTEYEAKKLVAESVKAGILCDGYSGSKVDIVVVNKNGAEVTRPFEIVCDKGEREGVYSYKKGSTAVRSEKVSRIEFDLVEDDVIVKDDENDEMGN